MQYKNQLCNPQQDTCHPRKQITILGVNYEENNCKISKSVSQFVTLIEAKTVGKYIFTSTLEIFSNKTGDVHIM